VAKHIACVVEGCSWTGDAPSEPELIEKVKAHGAQDHGLTQIGAELVARVKAAIENR
jgi:predicted small metal-binding protein